MAQLKQVEAERDAIAADPPPDDVNAAKIVRLARLKSIANETATVFTREVFYRHFDNRCQVGAFVGFDGSPWRTSFFQGQPQAHSNSLGFVTETLDLLTQFILKELGVEVFAERERRRRSRYGPRHFDFPALNVFCIARKQIEQLWSYRQPHTVSTCRANFRIAATASRMG